MKIVSYIALSLALLACTYAGNTGTDPAHRHAYGENVGWLNARSTVDHQLTIHFDGNSGSLTGFAWGENIGWVCFPTNGFGGVTLDASGNLAGYAWGENVGWINFPTDGNGGVSINTASGEFSGQAWGENIGWISFNSANHGVRTLAFDRQGQGTPNWWLARHGVSETYDAGDGLPAWQKYVMDVSPTNTGNALMISANTSSAGTVVYLSSVSARRFYSLEKRNELTAQAEWFVVPALGRISGTGNWQSMADTNAGSRSYYRVKVED